MDKPIIDVTDSQSPWTVFLETADINDGLPLKPLPRFDKDCDVMLFLKFYDPEAERIHYMGHIYISITSKVSSILPRLRKRAYLPSDARLVLFEEIKPNMLEKIEELDR